MFCLVSLLFEQLVLGKVVSVGIYVYICVCATLLVCNTGVHNPCRTGVCKERFFPEVSIADWWRNVEQHYCKHYFDGKKVTC